MENPSWLRLSLVTPIRWHRICATVFALGVFTASEIVAQGPQAPPTAPVRVVTEDYFGTKISDPYRYMENLKDPEVVKWFSEQDAYTRVVLSRIPGREALLKRIQQLDESGPPRVFDFQRFQNHRYFYQKRLASENIAKLYMRTGLQGPEKLILDPDKRSTKSDEHYTLNYYSPSLDGRFVAYGVSPSGSEDAVIHVLDLTTGKDTDESIDRSWYGGISWLLDGQPFFHVRFQKLSPGADPTERRLKSRVFLHRVGSDPERDLPVFGFGVNSGIDLDPADSCGVVSDPRISYAVAYVIHGFSNDMTLYIAPLESIGKATIKWQKIIDVDDEVVTFDARGDDLYLITHKNAPRFKVIHVSLSHTDLASAQVVVPGGEPVITSVAAMADALYVQELDGGIGKLLRLPYSKKIAQRVLLPFDGSFGMASGDPRLDGALFGLTSWTKAPKIFEYIPRENRVVDTKLQPLGAFDEPADIESKETRAPSYDGTLVPLSLVYKKGIKLDGSHPTLLIGYGAYSITIDPEFNPRYLAWIEQGGVLAFAHVRGGGEYGEEWHKGGMLQNKPNTWRDFIACAEFLIKQGYTSSAKLAGQGGSAGGILIGRALTERPELFAAALSDVGLSDMIRDMFSPDGPLNVPEYGDIRDQQGFRNLFEISAYYHVIDGIRYPAVMITTGMNDPRVVPWEPGKMAARLQAATTSGKPVLLRVDYQGGHGTIGGTKTQAERLFADQWSFLLWQFGVPAYQPLKSASGE